MADLSGLDDVALVEAVRARDEAAFEELVRRHQRKAYALALRITKREEDAREVVQDAFLNVWRKIDGFRGDAAFGSWLYRITASQALMKIRSKASRSELYLEDLASHFNEEGYFNVDVRDWSPLADEVADDEALGRRIQEAVDRLPEAYRVVFLLRDVEAMSNEEVAETLDLTVAAVKSRLHRARLALRADLDAFFRERFPTAATGSTPVTASPAAPDAVDRPADDTPGGAAPGDTGAPPAGGR
ncbi:MAG TPA: sigma-70 family RNA polymerase sigma factor [Myxococcota bacterium]|jgi:RNA polymerase sigma-70 factor (ECF subfamily)|nr:sigma-70 family RNA polymerase sigma factor [Myxococcota bacterium]